MSERRNVNALHVVNNNLKQFAISQYNKAGEQTITWPGLRSLVLKYCKMSPRATGRLLRFCPNLLSLELRSASGIELDYVQNYGHSLRGHGRRLRRLAIDAGDSWHGNEERLRHQMQRGALISGTGSLRDLAQLLDLEATPWILLFGPENEHHLANVLPGTLQMLTLLPCATREVVMDVEQEVNLLEADFRNVVVDCSGSWLTT
ncbi:uncharacterized protein MYCGRDRAFT_92587 [Zymoseptoria tritici IPO323]|uniref:F-box domain-containing protein n=1 Tax=Zymoseptoria tritici (strain CBS 115943 / IPO323) TaxID=336722 RepID=F9X8E6_ZYMTI|nr:uncharacterized protein MYCGRDRAFT_92587 [Zymoseptoria tritici IPO323]EGP88377.1 hypothetical protein MYCGRDRAFT_92587 [Zymoseptoria tritici IPO323]